MTRLRLISRKTLCAATLAAAGVVAPAAYGAEVPVTDAASLTAIEAPLDVADIDYPEPEEPAEHAGYTSAITHSHITLRPGQECRVAYAIRVRNDLPELPQHFFREPKMGPVPAGIEIVDAEGLGEDGGRAKFTIRRSLETPENVPDSVELELYEGYRFTGNEDDPTRKTITITMAPSWDSGEVTVPAAPCH